MKLESLTQFSYPPFVAYQLAELLQRDPVIASQVKEHIRPDELLELLDLTDYVNYLLDEVYEEAYEAYDDHYGQGYEAGYEAGYADGESAESDSVEP